MLRKIFYLIPVLFTVLLCEAQSGDQPTTFSGVFGFSDDGSGNYTNTEGSGWDNNMLTSANFIASDQDGSVKYVVVNNQDRIAFGLSASLATGLSDITYRFQLEGRLYVWDDNTLEGNYGRLNPGDVLEIVREGSEIAFKKNGVRLTTITLNSTPKIYVKASAKTSDLVIPNTAFVGTYYESMEYLAETIGTPCFENSTEGAINLTLAKGVAPYSYSWSNGSTTKDITGLAAGVYTVTVTDETGEQIVVPITVGQLVVWNYCEGQAEGESLYFDGNDDYVQTIAPVLDDVGGGDFTFEAWVNGAENMDHPVIFSNTSDEDGALFFFHNSDDSHPYKMLAVQLEGVNYFVADNGNFDESILNGIDHHVAVTRLGSLLSFYIDGALIGTQTIEGSPDISTGNDLRIGMTGNHEYPFDGNIGDVRIWNAARTAIEINDKKGSLLTGTEIGLVANWQMKEGEGQLATDKTDNEYDAYFGSSLSNDDSDPLWNTVPALQITYPCEPGLGIALSNNELEPNTDGKLFYTISQVNSTKMIGLNDIATASGNAIIDYSIQLNSDGNIYIYEGGFQVGGSYGAYGLNQELKIERVGSDIRYTVNNVLIKTTTTDPTKTLIVKTYLTDATATFNGVQTDFCNIPFFVIDSRDVTEITSYTVLAESINLDETFNVGNEEYLVLPFIEEGLMPIEIIINGLVEKEAKIELVLNSELEVISSIVNITENGETYSYYVDDFFDKKTNKLDFHFDDFLQKVPVGNNNCLSDNTMNWVSNKSYDENGVVISEGKTYLDNIGRNIQSQARNFSNNKILASQTIYDSFGRPAINTLSAPIYQKYFCYQPNFVTANNNQKYDYTKFDLENTSTLQFGQKDKPFNLDNNVKGSLGWYFSNNNTEEPYVATTGIPYSRVEYYKDPLGRPKKVAGISENYQMGSDHESKVFYGTAGYELAYVYGGDRNITKAVTVDPDGLESIVYKDHLDNVVATCYSGLENDCYDVPVKHDLDYYEGRSVAIHLPHIPGQKLAFKLNTARDCDNIAFVNIKIVDIETGRELLAGTDYNMNIPVNPYPDQKYDITFLGDYANRTLFLNLSYDYTPHYKNVVYPTVNYGPYLPFQSFEYKLGYSHWTLNYYDRKGRLTNTIAPEGVDCKGVDPNTGYAYELDHIDYEFYDGVNDIYTFNSGVFTNNFYNYEGYKNGISTIYTAPASQFHTVNIQLYPSLRQIDYTGGCGGIGPIGPADFDQLTMRSTNRQITDYMNFKQRTSSYNPSIIYTSENRLASDDISFYHKLLESDPLLLKNGLFVGGQNYSIGNGPSGGGAFLEFDNGSDPCLDPWYHCHNNIQDCNETGIDEGGGCAPQDPCSDEPPVLVATYQLEIELTIEDANGFMYVKPDGSVQATPYSYFVYPKVYKNCFCEYYWDYTSATTIDVTISDAVLTDYEDGIHANLKSIQVQKPSVANVFIPFDQNDLIHEFAQTIQMRARLRHDRTPFFNDAISHSMVSLNTYNDLNELVSTKTPDQGLSEYVYDVQGKPRFAQNAQQKNDNKFSYTNYDRAGRTVESGIYDYSALLVGAGPVFQFQNDAATYPINSGWTSVLTVLNESDGLEDAYCSEQVFSLYDVADAPTSPFNPFTTAPYTNYKQTHLLGRVSKTWNENSIMWYSYDMYGRVTWTIEYILDPSIASYKTVDYEYDAAGNVINKIYQKYDTEYFEHQYSYNLGQQLTKVETSSNSSIYYDQAKYSYYQHGALKRTEIGNKLQGIDYIYTIEGKLKAINSPNFGVDQITSEQFADPGGDNVANNGINTDIFGMIIDYHADDYKRDGTYLVAGGVDEKYTGTIHQLRWNLQDAGGLTTDLSSLGKQNAYQYKYNQFNWLTDATFGTSKTNCSLGEGSVCNPVVIFTADVNDQFKVNGITYDRNGNIETLVRNGNVTTGIAMDNLDYNYDLITQLDGDIVKTNNRLKHVFDIATTSAYATDIKNQSVDNYIYNDIGELTVDVLENKTYTYYQSGLAAAIKNTATGHLILAFEYNAKGQRLKKSVYDAGGVKTKEFFYIRDLAGGVIGTYEKDVSTTFVTKDFSIMGANFIGNYDPSALESRYFMYDHIGNVRATFRENAGNVEILSANEFYPFGMVTPGRNLISSIDKINYGYQGKELDQTGLNAFPLRMYDARLGRWLRTDPFYQYNSAYMAMGNNPISIVDPTGGWGEDGEPINVPTFTICGNCDEYVEPHFDISWSLFELEAKYNEFHGEGSSKESSVFSFAYTKTMTPSEVSHGKASRNAQARSAAWNRNSLRSKYNARSWQIRKQMMKPGLFGTINPIARGILANESNGTFRRLDDPRKPYAGFATKWNKQGPPDLGETAQFASDAATALIGGTIATVVGAPLLIEGGIVSTQSFKLATIKTVISVVSQGLLTERVNLVGVLTDGFLVPGVGDFLGSAFEVSVGRDGIQTSSVFGSKTHNEVLLEGTIGTFFSFKGAGIEHFSGTKSVLSKSLLNGSNSIGRIGTQAVIKK